MPQAPNELRVLMKEYFGDEVDDAGPIAYLKVNGWEQADTGLWNSSKPLSQVSQKEWECFIFLMQEWDHAYGSILPRSQK